ncbi:MAG: endonuclease VIII [Myxococcota bacterium]
MPEGPEIRRAADRVAKAVAGHAVEVSFGLPRLEAWAPVLSGAAVQSVTSHGKAMLTRFSTGHVVYSHNQLYGRWYIQKSGQLPPTNRQLRFALRGKARWALLYSASDIDVLEADDLDMHPFLRKLGPDVLDTDEATIRARLRSDEFRGRQLASLYLNQGYLAGLGNYLRAEILFLAKLDPTRRAADLSAAEIRRLAKHTSEVPQRSYRTGGIVLEERRANALKKQGAPRRERRFYVYHREGKQCRRCDTRIERFDAGGRHIFRCPTCQR